MGMQFNPMYQPTSTKTITVDGDLNLNPYDVLAVDGKFDTVEADEFVGGVGNFSSLTSAGNIVLNGDTDVKGLLHAEENLQVDGSLILEGSINNVNIDNNGNITAGKFNNVVLKEGVLSVTPTSGKFLIPSHTESGTNPVAHCNLCVLPLRPNTSYRGNLNFNNSHETNSKTLLYWNDTQNNGYNISIPANSDYTLNFNNIKYLIVTVPTADASVSMYNFTIS